MNLTRRSSPTQKISNQLARATRRASLALKWKRKKTRLAAFVTGCQRSGTHMLLKTLGQSPEIWTHDHRRRDLAYFLRHDPAYQLSPTGRVGRLASTHELTKLMRRNQAPVLAIHGTADAQLSNVILRDLADSRVIWIYRNFSDVASSAVNLWGDHQREVVRRFRRREMDTLKWRAEGMGDDTINQIVACDREDLSAHEGGALVWYARNQFFVKLGLERSERVLLLKYEDLVTAPSAFFPLVFKWLQVPYEPRFIGHVDTSSMRKHGSPEYSSQIRSLCESLLCELDTAYQANTLPLL